MSSPNVTKLSYADAMQMASNWQSLMESIDKEAEVGVVEKQGGDGFVLTMTVNGSTTSYQLTDLPEIDAAAPNGGASPEVLEGMLDKLGTLGKDLKFTDEELTLLTDRLKAMAEQAADGKAEIGKSLFDVFALMTLMIEVGQKERNAQRAMRKAEIEAIAANLQSQAEVQRDAARIQMTTACVALGVAIANAGFTIGMTAKAAGRQIKANQRQTNAEKAFDVAQSKMRGATSEAQRKDLIEGQKDSMVIKGKEVTITKGHEGELTAAGRERNAAYADVVNANQFMMQARAFTDLIQGFGQFVQGLGSSMAEMRRADATALQAEQKRQEEFLDLTKIMFNQSQSVIDAAIQAMQSVLQTENQNMLSIMKI